MRVQEIEAMRIRMSREIQSLDPYDISGNIFDQFQLQKKESWKTRVMRCLSVPAASVLTSTSKSLLHESIPFNCSAVFVGERFSNEYSYLRLKKLLPSSIERVLIPGCYLGGADVQRWLRYGVKHLDGCDVYSLSTRWKEIVPKLHQEYTATVDFRQASIEDLPYEDERFDLVSTMAVLEHVRNLRAMAKETSRVLKPRGLAWHGFGPTYYTFSGDHCVSAFGLEQGYDHVLLTEDDYQQRINDQGFFDKQPDPNLPFWARNNQFSFARSTEYLEIFSEFFEIEDIVLKLSEEGLEFRRAFPQKWNKLLSCGIKEFDLLAKSLMVILRKK
jgi:SAM-dependent methyltransferase